ncbi:flagellar basal body rod protein FlgC [Gallaecimonas xiamenensis]|uniref:Flagellar basal-body rod protein FlgC n=1 Tax=Gallaecimonas xiamenensis 3-C-1 TaxID=745411 RepID=K2JUA7_9GAMM|nr:flagellar basal body rod protein FlgC [Gallaecimonas xiamenensis]EKE73974.1 flagellar basal body rod protein FlgC [Gallaecimonas xiamenensis 3-C-1]
MAFNSIYDIAGSAMRAQTVRLNTVASNLANADSAAGSEAQAYRAIKPVFATLYQSMDVDGGASGAHLASANVRIADLVQSDRTIEKRFEPGNPIADGEGFVYYGNVNVVEEMADMMSASRTFQTAADVITRTNSMQQSLLRLGQA